MVPVTIGAHAFGASMVSSIALIFLLILGAFNLLNLLPMHRFDGGQVLRQILPTRNGLAAGTFAVTLAILWVGWRIGLPPVALIAGLAVFTILSLFARGRAIKPRSALEPITSRQRLAVSLGLAATLSLHAYAIVFACDRLFG
ncbi:hypothetical protein [Sinorhizobium sp. BG8]|uniref:hypothetical protein n=1 Tax=Sinorhizobium sp. BG8 TaxID=2613773 RepID=UPI001FEE7580|nr:hypothetical protein [Sinorhizobium sp. BG8]